MEVTTTGQGESISQDGVWKWVRTKDLNGIFLHKIVSLIPRPKRKTRNEGSLGTNIDTEGPSIKKISIPTKKEPFDLIQDQRS